MTDVLITIGWVIIVVQLISLVVLWNTYYKWLKKNNLRPVITVTIFGKKFKFGGKK